MAVLESVRDSLKAFKEILLLTLQIWRILRKYPVFSLTVVVSIGCLVGIYWFSVGYPALTIRRYFAAIDDGKFDIAWGLLDQGYRRKWNNDPEVLERLYGTTISYGKIEIEYEGGWFSWIPTIVSPSIRYEVTYTVQDRFTKVDIVRPEHARNALWLRLAHWNDYARLIDGTLPATEENLAPTLVLDRRVVSSVVVNRSDVLTWRIARFATKEEGLYP